MQNAYITQFYERNLPVYSADGSYKIYCILSSETPNTFSKETKLTIGTKFSVLVTIYSRSGNVYPTGYSVISGFNSSKAISSSWLSVKDARAQNIFLANQCTIVRTQHRFTKICICTITTIYARISLKDIAILYLIHSRQSHQKYRNLMTTWIHVCRKLRLSFFGLLSLRAPFC